MTQARPPEYFDQIQQAADRRWQQLEDDPELAGPWRQLFAQVQSPRHVLSELLQNADDAGAKHVRVQVGDGFFEFEHDGRDFTADEFRSLCRFGFSNKRNLHTIGFRGIGFKSTFSLGDNVDVYTPTLSVRFNKHRFTLPDWLAESSDAPRTKIRVKIQDANRAKELAKNFDDWTQSPASLLFFQSVHELEIDGHLIRREVVAPGPCENSDWVRLTGTVSDQLLVIRSQLEAFPDDAIAEIKQERNADDLHLPPCSVEIVLGIPGDQRLYVVLPTGVRPHLPFSCNGPFLQDPARFGIKDPAISATNRWLLERVGKLAAMSLSNWLDNRSLDMESRAQSYSLLPSPPRQEDTLDGDVTESVANKFRDQAEDEPILLTADSELAIPPKCNAFPPELHLTWDATQLNEIFDKLDYPILAPEIGERPRKLLSNWHWISWVSLEDVIQKLRFGKPPPKPEDWNSLAHLWNLVQSQSRLSYAYDPRRTLQIVPVEGDDRLLAAKDVVRLLGKKALADPDDWRFLSDLVRVLDTGWAEFLTSRPDVPETEHPEVEAARYLLASLGLDSATTTDKILTKATECLFGRDSVQLADAVRLAHITAAFDAKAPAALRYVTRNMSLTPISLGVISDVAGVVEGLLPEDWASEHLLHDAYLKDVSSCDASAWNRWAASEKSGLVAFVPFEATTREFWSQGALESFLKSRNVKPPSSYNYRSGRSEVCEYDFDQRLLEHWHELENTDETIWRRVVELILEGPSKFWRDCIAATVHEVSQNANYRKPAQCEDFVAAWITRLSALPCLRDGYDRPRVPAELFMRTPDTEALMGVEPFVKAEFDLESTRPLLKLLGVRDTPSGPEKLVDRIRALAGIESPPVHEVAKWYEALDKVVTRCGRDDLLQLKHDFATERLVLSNDGEWMTSGEVFRSSDEDSLPGAPLVHPSVAELPLWSRVGIAERPTEDLVIAWLEQLESGAKLDVQMRRRVRGCVQAFPEQAWLSCGHWPSLENIWTPVDELDLRVDRASVVRVGELFPAVRARTADLRNLTTESANAPVFAALRNLSAAIEFRLTEQRSYHSPAPPKPWMQQLGVGLQRVKLQDEENEQTVRQLGVRLANTQWHTMQVLRVTPYLDGTPAGQPHSPEVLWHDRVLYVIDLPMVQIFKGIVDEVSRPFSSVAIADAIKACAERDAEFVQGYLAHNFELVDEIQDVVPPPTESSESSEVATEAEVTESTASEPVGGQGDWHESEFVIDEIIPVVEDSASPDEQEELDIEPEIAEEPAEEGIPAPPTSKPPREPRTTLIARYAEMRKFQWDDLRELYVHPNGSTLGKCEGVFNFEIVTSKGESQRRLWLDEQCLTRGVDMPAELWDVLSRNPEGSAVVVINDDDTPREIPGPELLSLVQRGQVQLFPAKYRLRQDANRPQGSELPATPRNNSGGPLASFVRNDSSSRATRHCTLRETFTLSFNDILAAGYFASGCFVVAEGSTASATLAADLPEKYLDKRSDLLRTKKLREQGDHLIFDENVRFASPLQAACVIAGAELNDLDEWRTVDGKTLRQWKSMS